MEGRSGAVQKTQVTQNKHALYGSILLHGLNDTHSTTLPAIIPMLSESISLTMSQAGVLSALFGTICMLLQPVTGYLADMLKRPWFAVFGMLISAAGASLLPLSPNFGAALICVGVMGIGTSLFHPQGSGLCGAAADKNRLAFSLSLFHACGTLGGAVGPLYVVFMISVFGRKGFPLAAIPAGLLISFFLFRAMGNTRADPAAAEKETKGASFLHELCFILSRIGWVVAVASIRDAVFQSIRVFTPTLFVQRGASIAMGSAVVLAVTLTAALAAVAGGRLSDSIGEKKVLFGSLAIAPLFLIFGVSDHGVLSIVSLMAGFAFLQSTMSVTMAIAQKKCTGARSMSSSLASGASWGIANLLVTPVGFLADHIGLQHALEIVAFLPWCIILWALLKTAASRRQGSAVQ